MSSPFARLRTEDEELMFDAGVMEGRDKERERIIKLLEEAKHLQATDELEWGIEQAIALIKGENK